MIVKAVKTGHAINVVAVTIFGVSLISMYGASGIYHGVSKPELKKILRKVNHLNIYFLIAGTYTPIALIALSGVYGWIIFALLWGAAIAGFVYKVLFLVMVGYQQRFTSLWAGRQLVLLCKSLRRCLVVA